MFKKIQLVFFSLFVFQALIAQHFTPGFDPKEYAAMLSLAHYESSIPDKADRGKVHEPYKQVYKSAEIGLKNLWCFYLNEQNQGVIVVRGTVGDQVSWLENYYCAMVPATGSLQLDANTRFDYKLAESKEAAVHVGWTIGMAYLVRDMMPKIKEYYQKGVKEFYLFGHSQGGVLAYLINSYLYYQKQAGNLPKDMMFKTYCSAAPKPGNMQYVYDFDFINRGGWAYTVVNTADWVPETPYTIQRVADMNENNPLVDIPTGLKKQKLPLRIIGNYFYGRLNRKTTKAQRLYTKYLGHRLFNFGIKKALPDLVEPDYLPTMSYMRAGNPIILMPDEDYRAKYNSAKGDKFVHHHYGAYYYLLKKYY